MWKNRSFKDNSFGHGRGSRGKEMGSSRGEETRRASERLNCSEWQKNPNISQNILRELINYSNLSGNRSTRGATLAVFEKEEDEAGYKMSKGRKGSTADLRMKSKKLILER